MAKILDYPKVTALTNDNVFLLDGPTGTKGILTSNLAKALSQKMAISDIPGESLYEFLDPVINVELRRNIWRGKSLGSTVTTAQYNEIGNGTFRGLFIGDYWTINNHTWRIMDIDYWYNTGLPLCKTHHLLIFPDAILTTGKMNDTNTTEGGFAGSKMFNTTLDKIRTTVKNEFGASHILVHSVVISNSVTNGASSSSIYYDGTVDIPTTHMIFGQPGYSNINDGLKTVSFSTESATQISGLILEKKYILNEGLSYWLREVASGSSFSSVDKSASFSYEYAGSERGIRPVFGICKANA